MSKGPVLLASACASLLLAAGGWLVFQLWQSWEDGRQLERQNRELQASLEASRIRIENYCEYPMEALCPVDSTAGRQAAHPPLAGEAALPEPPPAPRQEGVGNAAPLPVTAPAQGRDAAAAPGRNMPKAEEGKNSGEAAAAKAQPEVQAEQKGQPAVERQPSPARQAAGQEPVLSGHGAVAAPEQNMPGAEEGKNSGEAAAAKAQPEVQAEQKGQSAVERQPTPAHQAAGQEPAPSGQGAAAAPAQKSSALSGIEITGNAIAAGVASLARAPLPDAASLSKGSAAAQESEPLPSVEKEPLDVQEQAPPPKQLRKTWTSLETRGNLLIVHIAGEGTELHASGMLEGRRYEVTLEGLWKLHARFADKLNVKVTDIFYRDGNTVLAFSLYRQPRICRVRREDGRTIAIEIQ